MTGTRNDCVVICFIWIFLWVKNKFVVGIIAGPSY